MAVIREAQASPKESGERPSDPDTENLPRSRGRVVRSDRRQPVNKELNRVRLETDASDPSGGISIADRARMSITHLAFFEKFFTMSVRALPGWVLEPVDAPPGRYRSLQAAALARGWT